MAPARRQASRCDPFPLVTNASRARAPERWRLLRRASRRRALLEASPDHRGRDVRGTIPRADGQVAVVNRWVLSGATGQRYVYDPHANTVAIAPFSAQDLSAGTGGLNIFDAPSVAAYLTKVRQGTAGRTHLLPQQTLDGVTVDAIQMDGSTQEHLLQLTVY